MVSDTSDLSDLHMLSLTLSLSLSSKKGYVWMSTFVTSMAAFGGKALQNEKVILWGCAHVCPLSSLQLPSSTPRLLYFTVM